jgi:Concanavalin A-like lectin/glucanases superfamily
MARQFNGTDQRLQSATTVDLSTSPQLSFMVWIWVNGNATQVPIEFGNDTATGHFFIYDGGAGGANNWNFAQKNGADFVFTGPATAGWHQVILTVDRSLAGASELTGVYIDGTSQSKTYGTGDSSGNFANATLTLMAATDAGLFLAGRMAEVAIWSGTLLNQTQVTALWNSGAGVDARTVGTPTFYWQVCGTASPEPPLVGAPSLTVTGATSVAHPISGSGICAAAAGVNRLYLAADATLTIAGLTPTFAAWQESGSAARRLMTPSLLADPQANVAVTTTTPGNTTLYRQFISAPLVAGITFTSGTSTFSCQILGLESAINDNIINRVRCVKVISRDGGTVRATLIALGNATSVAEWNTALRNLTFLGATASGASYTTVAGDRLVLEVGHDDSAGSSIQGTLRFGADSTGTGDLGVNETDTTTTLRPWFESSVTLTFEVLPPPPVIKEFATARARRY